MKAIIIDGNKIIDKKTLLEEFRQKLTKEVDWELNLDGLEDILMGDFLVFEYEEKITLIWKNHNYSKEKLGKLFNVILEMLQDKPHITLELK